MVIIFKLEGATCTGCKIAIESFVSKISGVEDVFVDSGTNTLQVTFDEFIVDRDLETYIPAFIKKIGYDAHLQSKGIK